MRLEHRSTPRAIGTTGLKSPNQARRNRDGSIENTLVRLAIPSRAKSPLKKCRGGNPLPRYLCQLSVTPRPFRQSITPRQLQVSVTPSPFQLGVTPAPLAFQNNQPVSRRSPRTGALPKWQACCSEHSAATERIRIAYAQRGAPDIARCECSWG